MEITHYENSDYTDLDAWLNAHWGQKAEFPNGCIVWLEEDVGMIWRTDPYNQDTGCNYKDGWEKCIRNWLEFWDEDRNETGKLTN